MDVDPAADQRRKNKGGLESELERHYDDLQREMMLMAADRPHKQLQQHRRHGHRPDLLQNCDLPPPAKLFGPVPTLQRLETAAAKDHKADDGLLRALRLSQSRAREAEDKLAAAGATNVDLAALLVRDSVALSAHRRWVMMLEAENSLLRGPRRDADVLLRVNSKMRKQFFTKWKQVESVLDGVGGTCSALPSALEHVSQGRPKRRKLLQYN
ncbi:hypothetical protein Zm00014a_028421 [Zea mays]|uniref:Uncharacterized protein n=1 Tax=Zea mays TaxID=4577 RepID=A0A317YBH1_MAIZE|nr:hypothetical protein Zm00014a_028421 [Zea mays]